MDTLAANVTGSLSYTDADTLTVGSVGSTNGISSGNGTVTLTMGDTLTLSGNVTTGGTVTVTAHDLSLLGTIDAGSADVILIPAMNSETIGVGDATGKDFTVDDTELSHITTTGTIIIGSLLNTGGITVGAITGSKKLDFVTGGNLTFTGNVTASTFTASATGGITISNPINASTSVDISNSGSGNITVNAKITATGNGTNIYLTNSGGNITVNAALDPNAIEIISDTGDVFIDAPVTATDQITVIAGNGTGTGNVLVDNTGGNTGSLTQTVPGRTGIVINAGSTSGNITLQGPVTAADTLSMSAPGGNISQTSDGPISATTLVLSTSGSIDLAEATTNTIGTLGSVTRGARSACPTVRR